MLYIISRAFRRVKFETILECTNTYFNSWTKFFSPKLKNLAFNRQSYRPIKTLLNRVPAVGYPSLTLTGAAENEQQAGP